jgi:hypothetical protein
VGVAALHGDASAGSVKVAPFERRPLVRPESRLGGEDDEGPVERPELGRERVDLLPLVCYPGEPRRRVDG